MSVLEFAGAVPWGWGGGAWAVVAVLAVVYAERERRRMRENVDFASELAVEASTAFRAVSDAAPVMIWTAGATGRATYCNPEMLRFFGHKNAEDLDWRAAVHPDDQGAAHTHLSPLLSPETPSPAFLRVRRHDGSWRWMYTVAQTHGNLRVGIGIDATAWKDAQRELTELITAKENFLAVTSHELRTPLTAIIGFASLLKEGEPVPLPKEAVDTVERIEQAAYKLHHLVEEVLLFNNLESAQEKVVRTSVDPTDLVLRVQGVMLPRARALGLRLAVDTTYAPHTLTTDSDKLSRALLNLVSNALKFTKEGLITISVAEAGPEVRFSVADTGIGIDPEDQGIMFEPFWQARQSMVREVGGMGLGLSVCRRLVELLGGSIMVESHEGAGSTFTLSIPK